MPKSYQPQEFEKKWRETWVRAKINQARSGKPAKGKKFILDMFPYPSGEGLHVGHTRGFTATDILSRFFRMKGYEVLHPIGWDAFGLPAENAAIKTQKNPMDMVPHNIANFKRQCQMMGFSYDWSREFATTDPEYYRYTQWLFIQFFKLGLLYKKNTPVYFCNSCQTGLAEEEVLPDGTHERCGNPITRKNLPQWIFKITDYSDSLLNGLNGLEWPQGILQMQKNWIGKKQGINITYRVKDSEDSITCFTTRPDTNFGATFIVLAPEHSFMAKISNGKVQEYIHQSLAKTDQERISEGRVKTGVFTGYYAINSLSGQEMPIWVSDFVLSDFGTGAVVGVPGHDKRDFEFARQFKLPIIRVVAEGQKQGLITKESEVFEGEGTVINSEFLNGLSTKLALVKITKHLEQKQIAKRVVSYHLRDWIFSRQRYWGEPIPMVYCERCAKQNKSYFDTQSYKIDIEKVTSVNQALSRQTLARLKKHRAELAGWYPMSESELPLTLPYLKQYQPTSTGESPLASVTDWVNTTCPHCRARAKKETDTMPNWAGSCWYFVRFSAKEQELNRTWLAGQQLKTAWLPVDWYIGGAEHAVLHLLYARFWMHVLHDLKLIDFREPFSKLNNVGMVLAEDHRKMSKSLGNVVNPDKVVAKFGADSLRVYEMFMAPFSQEIAWSMTSLLGAKRFLSKIYQLFSDSAKVANHSDEEDKKLVAKLQNTIMKVESDITNVKFNTAISTLMEFANSWQKGKLALQNAQKYLKLLAPFAPFLAEEIWQSVLKNKASVHLEVWPIMDKTALTREKITIPVQVNGRLRALLHVSVQAAGKQKEVQKLALQDPKIQQYLHNQKARTIYVPGKVINFIISK